MSNNSKAKSNYDKLYKVLSAWYTPDQINEIWTMLKNYERKKLQATSSKLDSLSQI